MKIAYDMKKQKINSVVSKERQEIHLPNEVWLNILSQLLKMTEYKFSSLVRLREVSKQLSNVVKDNSLWKFLFPYSYPRTERRVDDFWYNHAIALQAKEGFSQFLEVAEFCLYCFTVEVYEDNYNPYDSPPDNTPNDRFRILDDNPQLRRNEDIAMLGVKVHPQYLNEEDLSHLKKDRAIVMTAVQWHGDALAQWL